ncbi:AroM family protein [Paenibacillus filicis]|uniref:AroM family protein n=1 Tax=Paenibacillus gyeongsangnamensis TaxID=3388067 RepID=A0ABT4QE22_9BACL|nr:AroM family protein [Paenibacillus filicis]MCZ8515118.1 AroM family protein [Paenibacillus filicis]
MGRLGMITIGQAPRSDVAPIVEKYLEDRAELVQAGVLDGLSKAYIEEHLYPVEGDYVLTSRLTNGESVVMARHKIQPILQSKINELEAQGIKQILLLCTGVFPGLHTGTSYLIEPDHIIPPAIKAMVGSRRLGVLVPLEEQKESLRSKYEPHGFDPVFAVASPYKNDEIDFRKAAQELKDQADLLLLDCMGYTEEARRLLAEATGLPAVLSNAIMAKLVSEMI